MAGESATENNVTRGFARENAHLLLPCLAVAALAGVYVLNGSSFEPSRSLRIFLGWVYILGCLTAGVSGIVMLVMKFRGESSTTRGFFASQVAGAIGVGIYLLLANSGFNTFPR